MPTYPPIIQGGMGVAVSSWPLASAVARRGQIGVISGTALDTVFARKLQLGDPTGDLREALSHFPIQAMADRILERYFIEGGKAPCKPFKSKPMPSVKPSTALTELIVVANFVETFLAKRGHDGLIGINLLEKVQLPTLPSLFGAMLAGVDFVLMGAGIPRAIPGALDSLSELQVTELNLTVAGANAEDRFVSRFDPMPYTSSGIARLKRPQFIAIVSSSALALTLARKSTGRVDGFVVEGPTAGGHNAPPRGPKQFDASGQPIYGERDVADLQQFRELGLPFWLAGSYGSAQKLQEAQNEGAQGIQVGTAFAFCDESGINSEIKRNVVSQSVEHRAALLTDPLASPTGFPFKVVRLEDTVSESGVYLERERICDLGYLREMYKKADGAIGYRCSGEPVEDYLAKGGSLEETDGRKCMCNGLLTTVGLGQIRNGKCEPAIVTAGDDVRHISQFLKPGCNSYSASDVVDRLLSV